ncbi:hypothetical protein EU545_02330 [Candidatus Thorarchaeota archaeon]|nr:MAG: hypothetical protein EU545_02330 [Candidatus Thorarchaeota archaeon]
MVRPSKHPGRLHISRTNGMRSTMQAMDKDLVQEVSSFYSENSALFEEIGVHFKTPQTYLYEYSLRHPGVEMSFLEGNRGLNFAPNKDRYVHRWTKYIEGFSEEFVFDAFNRFSLEEGNLVLDPFAGSGTVNVCAKMRNLDSVGVEINPTICRILRAKTNWRTDPRSILNTYEKLSFDEPAKIEAPQFLRYKKQFNPRILENILRIKGQILHVENTSIRQYLDVAFLSILLPSSNLKRSPSIGYDWDKSETLEDELPLILFDESIHQIVHDLQYVRNEYDVDASCRVYTADSKELDLSNEYAFDAVVTSPPYLNSFDYVGNYKLEIGWLDDASSTKDLRHLRDRMILCDNVSRRMIRDYALRPRLFDHDWLDYIMSAVKPRMTERVGIRRTDYSVLLRKYFEDIFLVLQNIFGTMRAGGEVAWVVGDSLILDVYVPTDLLTMEIAETVGFKPEGIEVGRVRRSGIRRSFKLRESVLYFRK